MWFFLIWSISFILRVDDLLVNKADSLQLVTQPNETFSIRYPAGVPEQMYDLTQGHPALLQRICKELVDIANKEGRRDFIQADLIRFTLNGGKQASSKREGCYHLFFRMQRI